MRSSKSILAGVAAGALGLALVPMISVGTANAAAYTAATTAVRVTYTATTLDPVPYARTAWTAAPADDTAIVTLTSAPTAGAKVTFASAQGTVSFGTAANNAQLGAPTTSTTLAIAGTADDSGLFLAADTPGTYAGTVQTYNAGAASNTATFTFTTRGAPASFGLKVNSASVPKSTLNSRMFTLEVKDAGGSLTQIQSIDGVTMSTNETGVNWGDDTTVTSAKLYAGTYNISMTTGGTAGSFTATATPTGTPWGTAQTGSYTVINNVAATSIGLVDSATALNQATAVGAGGSGIVKPGTTSVTFGLTVAAGNAGAPVVVTLGGTAFATAPAPAVVSTNAAGVGTFTVDVPASGALLNRTITATQAGVGTYTATYTVGTIDCSTITRNPSAGTIALATGKDQPVAFSIDDSYGNPVSGMVVVATSGTTVKSATTNALGAAEITLPDLSTSTVTSKTWTFTVDDPTSATNPDVTGCSTGGAKSLTLQYSAAGTVTIASPTYNTATEAAWVAAGTKPVVPYTGVIAPNGGGSVTSPGRLVALGATVGVNNVNVAFTGGDGVWFCTDDTFTLGTAAFGVNCAEKAETITASGSAVTAYVTSTKTGPQTITATTTSGATVTWTVNFASEDAAARNITLTAAPPKQQTNRAVEAKVKVTDVFGNSVAMTAGGASINLTTDKGTLAGGLNIVNIDVTLADGTATVMATSPLPGIATITATGTGGQFGNAVNVPFTGAAKSVSPATVAVEWTGAATESITITGSRTTVGGKPGIKIDGAVTGLEDGKTVVPYFRFPGETTFAQGTARPPIEGGKFTWQRKTGKKFYAYVTSEDGAVTSNRVIIAAN